MFHYLEPGVGTSTGDTYGEPNDTNNVGISLKQYTSKGWLLIENCPIPSEMWFPV